MGEVVAVTRAMLAADASEGSVRWSEAALRGAALNRLRQLAKDKRQRGPLARQLHEVCRDPHGNPLPAQTPLKELVHRAVGLFHFRGRSTLCGYQAFGKLLADFPALQRFSSRGTTVGDCIKNVANIRDDWARHGIPGAFA